MKQKIMQKYRNMYVMKNDNLTNQHFSPLTQTNSATNQI